MQNTQASVTAECGTVIAEGTPAYDYYSMKPGKIVPGTIEESGWFYFGYADGSRNLLNGQRICSVAFAKRRGFPGV